MVGRQRAGECTASSAALARRRQASQRCNTRQRGWKFLAHLHTNRLYCLYLGILLLEEAGQAVQRHGVPLQGRNGGAAGAYQHH